MNTKTTNEFLEWISENASRSQVLKITWWNRFNTKKFKALQHFHSIGVHFPYAMKYIKENKPYEKVDTNK